MAPEDDTNGADFHLLVAECMERCDVEGPPALAGMCDAYPEHAEALRRVIEPLIGVGLGHTTPDNPLAGRGLAPGTSVGGYEIAGELGRGGMGVVFEARDTRLDRPAALKILASSDFADEERIERFRREAAAAGSLRHDGLVRVFGYGVDDGFPWIAMELVAGAPLDRVLEMMRREQLPFDAALRRALDVTSSDPPVGGSHTETYRRIAVVLRLAEALHHAHEHGIIHRDVKPSNILVRPDGEPVLTDFGLARRADLPNLTQTGTFAGTPFYASPEQAAGRKVDAQSDVFSLGCTLYELLTLERPFAGRTSRDVLRAIETREPTYPQRHDSSLPEDVSAVTLKALAKDRRERYASAAAFAEDLRALLELRPVSARRATAWQRMRRWARREPLRAALAIVVAAGSLLVAGLAGYLISQRPLVAAAQQQQLVDEAETATTDGFVAYFAQQRAKAQALFDRALELIPDKQEAIVGRILAETHPDDDRVLAAVDGFLAKAPDDPVLLRLKDLYLRQESRLESYSGNRPELGPPTRPLECFVESLSILSAVSGRRMSQATRAADEAYERAEQLMESAIVASESKVPLYYLYWATFIAGPRDDEAAARRVANGLRRLWPKSGSTWRAAGSALLDFDVDEALECFEHALALEPDEPMHRISIARAHVQARSYELARAQLEDLLSVESTVTRALVHEDLATVLSHLKELDPAIEHARSALTLTPAEEGALWGNRTEDLIYYLDLAGAKQEAERLAREAIAKRPQKLDFRIYLVRRFLGEGRGAEALEMTREVVALRPALSASWDYHGKALLAVGQRDEAVVAMRKLCELEPDNAIFVSNLAYTLLKNGELDEATRVSRKAVRLNEFSAPAPLLVLAKLLYETGELEEAEHYARSARDLESLPRHKNTLLRRQARQLLDSIVRKREASRR